MNVKVFIELGKDGTYGAYVSEKNPLPFGAIGEGKTVEETKNDFLNVLEAYRPDYAKDMEGLSVEFHYDIPSFLSYYSKKLSLAGLERITGISQGQLSHYVTGRRRPSKETVKKIQVALNRFGEELSNVHFV